MQARAIRVVVVVIAPAASGRGWRRFVLDETRSFNFRPRKNNIG
jgi:hypothetical protein